ncbi:NmrA family NAD(P)-binding protein [Nonomuraea sp. NPDC000554]|uniref:SDR family oxidoreductase n=1 Tax=Nonomuraea sp. NPDC000554 TaxID=3154259 RepID=UPI0033198027
MTFLVIGATGAQGGAVARELVASGQRVRGLARSDRMPDGVQPFVGDLGDAALVKAAFTGVSRASVLLPMVYEPELVAAYVRNVIDAALAAGVERLVFNTGNRTPSEATGVAAFETRRAAVASLLESGVPTVVLRPPVYLDNLLAPWVAGPLAHEGVLRYPLPAGLPVAWLSHADLATITVAALTRDGLDGAVLDVGGPDTVTGTELAAAFGPGVRYAEQDVDEFEHALARALGEPTAAGVAATYRWLATTAGAVDPVDPDLEERLGVRLTPLREWIAAQPWPWA